MHRNNPTRCNLHTILLLWLLVEGLKTSTVSETYTVSEDTTNSMASAESSSDDSDPKDVVTSGHRGGDNNEKNPTTLGYASGGNSTTNEDGGSKGKPARDGSTSKQINPAPSTSGAGMIEQSGATTGPKTTTTGSEDTRNNGNGSSNNNGNDSSISNGDNNNGNDSNSNTSNSSSTSSGSSRGSSPKPEPSAEPSNKLKCHVFSKMCNAKDCHVKLTAKNLNDSEKMKCETDGKHYCFYEVKFNDTVGKASAGCLEKCDDHDKTANGFKQIMKCCQTDECNDDPKQIGTPLGSSPFLQTLAVLVANVFIGFCAL